MSGYPITWSPQAQAEFVEILEFTEIQFNAEVAADCVLLVEASSKRFLCSRKCFPPMAHRISEKRLFKKI